MKQFIFVLLSTIVILSSGCRSTAAESQKKTEKELKAVLYVDAGASGNGVHHWAALLALAVGVAGSFNILLPAAAWTGIKGSCGFCKSCYLALWLLPLGTFLLPVSPFPRVWFAVFPVWAVLLARGIRKNRLINTGYWIIPVALSAAMHFSAVTETVSPWCSRAGQDDFFAPYFLHRDFVPHHLTEVLAENPGNGRIYMPLSADPWAVWWASGRNIAFDSPRGRIATLSDGTVVIIRRGCGIAEVTSRFGGRLEKTGEAGMFEVYRWRE